MVGGGRVGGDAGEGKVKVRGIGGCGNEMSIRKVKVTDRGLWE